MPARVRPEERDSCVDDLPEYNKNRFLRSCQEAMSTDSQTVPEDPWQRERLYAAILDEVGALGRYFC